MRNTIHILDTNEMNQCWLCELYGDYVKEGQKQKYDAIISHLLKNFPYFFVFIITFLLRIFICLFHILAFVFICINAIRRNRSEYKRWRTYCIKINKYTFERKGRKRMSLTFFKDDFFDVRKNCWHFTRSDLLLHINYAFCIRCRVL